MTLTRVPLATTGSVDGHTAQQFRMMIKDLARDQQGVTTGSDLKVTALGTPGAAVQVGDGSGVIAGKASVVQGHYNAFNIGSEEVPIAPTGGSPRNDMVVLRVEDPEYEGALDPAVDDINYFHVISGVSAGATEPTAGMSAIPLARIEIPASTSVITSSMVKDIRKVANARRERHLLPYYFPGPLEEISGTSATWKTHPLLSGSSPSGSMQNLAIPAWAASAKILFRVAGLRLSTGYVFGAFRFQLGTEEAVQSVNIDDNQGTGIRRIHSLEMAETISLTTTAGAAMRGTSQAFKSRMKTDPLNEGNIGVDGATSFIIDVEFLEGPL